MHKTPPQQYSHKVECTLHAPRNVADSVQKLSEFLEEQLGADWKKQDHLLKHSVKFLGKAQR
jgi:hypothetical protein